jgi:hypothetical protein
MGQALRLCEGIRARSLFLLSLHPGNFCGRILVTKSEQTQRDSPLTFSGALEQTTATSSTARPANG